MSDTHASRLHPTLQSAATAALETAVNTALRLDPASRAALAALAGQVFHLQCSRPALDIYLIPHTDGIQLASRWEGAVSAGLQGSGDDYLELLRSNDPGATLINGAMTVSGDSSALLRLRDIAAQLDLDWEAPLARVFGDVVGHQLANSLRTGTRLLRDAANGLRRQFSDYAHEESSWLLRRWQFEQFRAEVSELRSRGEQLQQRARELRELYSRRARN